MIRRITYSILLLLGPVAAYAAPTYCVPGPNSDGLSLADVTFRGSSADNCYGVVVDNDKADNIGFAGFAELLKSDGTGTGSIGGVNFTLTGVVNGTSAGVWTLSWVDPAPIDLPLTLDLVVVLKASDRFASYLFTNELIQAMPDSGAGTWKIEYENEGGQIPGLSHMSIYAKIRTTTIVGEPGTLGLFGAGLALVGLLGRRRRT